MSSHVVVIDSTARRAVVKVTPSKHLSDVLGEACSKLHLNPSHYGLKHQRKQVDLSLPIRLSGLSSGAKLELVQLSRSPSLVSVALQLPESEVQGTQNGRLVDKFPSDTTLWLVLRKFEAGVAGNGATRNLTARAAPPTPTATSGSGRLFYQTPVVQFMNREMSSFTDLQNSLAQLGFNSGSALFRLSFRTTDRPLEEAMSEIDTYFKSVDGDQGEVSAVADAPLNLETAGSSGLEEPTPESTPSNAEQSTPAETLPMAPEQQQQPNTDTNTDLPQSPPVVSSRPVTVYAPPSGSTPQSAKAPHNEKDYVPSVDHAKAHQQRLNEAGKPGRLASDAELAAQESAVQEKLAKVTEVDVKVRFPDQSQVVSKFAKEDTASELYAFVRGCLDEGVVGEAFSLSFLGGGTAPSQQQQQQGRGQKVIPDSRDVRIIHDLRMDGRVLVNFVWDGNAALTARRTGQHVLKPDLRQAASQIKVQDIAPVEEDEGEKKSWMSKLGGDKDASGSGSGSGSGGGGNKMPKWLKLPGKK